MTVVMLISAGMLVAAALLSLIRLLRGPGVLDRMVAVDVILSCLIAGIAVEAAYNRHGNTISVLIVLALLGFVGSVAVARFSGGDTDAPLPPHGPEPDPRRKGPR
ncbi:MAG: monovalent cation/H+ antiporter complex subunit F [Solirubrobacteraceae bacterium]